MEEIPEMKGGVGVDLEEALQALGGDSREEEGMMIEGVMALKEEMEEVVKGQSIGIPERVLIRTDGICDRNL